MLARFGALFSWNARGDELLVIALAVLLLLLLLLPSSSPPHSPPFFFRHPRKNLQLQKQRVALAFHGFALVRELWCALTVRGTFSRIRRAAWNFVRDPRGGFVLPPPARDAAAAAAAAGSSSSASPSKPLRRSPGVPDDSWHVTERDLHAFRAAVESPEALESWGQPMLVKDFGTLTYKAWRRCLPDGKTEYKSITVAMDSTAEEFSDFFLDDNARGGVRTGEDQGSGWVSFFFFGVFFFFFFESFPFSKKNVFFLFAMERSSLAPPLSFSFSLSQLPNRTQ